MTASDPTPQAIAPAPGPADPTPGPGVAGEAAAQPASVASEPTSTSDTAQPPVARRSRKKLVAFGVLAAAVFVFAGLVTWYALTRKPITEVFPVIAGEDIPSYSFSIYGISKPTGVAVNPSGDRIYVSESEGQRMVRIFDGKGNPIGSFAPPKSIPATRIPMYIAINPTNGDVYVSDRMARAIFVYDAAGQFRRVYTPKVEIPSWQPLGLAFDSSGNLYVGDVGGSFHTIHEFAPDGSLVRTIGEAGQFNFPNGLAVDSKGNLFVGDGNNGRVAAFDGTGRQVSGVAHGVGEGQLALPRGLAFDDHHRLGVVDATGQDVSIYSISDTGTRLTFVGSIGVEGTGDGQVEYPFGLAADGRGRLYIADWGNDRLEVWSY